MEYVAVALVSLGKSFFICIGYSFLMVAIAGLIVSGIMLAWEKITGTKSERFLTPAIVIVFALQFIAMLSYVTYVEMDNYIDERRAKEQPVVTDAEWEAVVRAAELASYYKDEYPMTWGYIQKNSDMPYDYLEFYHQVWGDMQSYTGDGINFDTLTRYERSLVNYPPIGSYVYFASSKSKEYHSTKLCYSLLKSDPISRPSTQRHNYDPCSKCVKQ